MTVLCKTDEWECPYIVTCIARLNDPSIVGCGLPLYMSGMIEKGDIYVTHRIKADKDKPKKREKHEPKRKKRNAQMDGRT